MQGPVLELFTDRRDSTVIPAKFQPNSADPKAEIKAEFYNRFKIQPSFQPN